MTEKPSKNEEEYFARRDAELRRSHHMKCPKCGYDLITGDWHGVQIDQCTHCHGLWFDAGEAEQLLQHPERGIFTRVFGAVMRGVTGAKVLDE